MLLPLFLLAALAARAAVAQPVAPGVLFGWGNGDDGELTVNHGFEQWPVRLAGISGVAGMAAGGDHSVAFTVEGLVYAFGDNRSGQLGNGYADSSTPVQVQGLPAGARPVQVAAGPRHSLVLLDDGTVWTWGDNSNGELGRSGVEEDRVARQVPGLPRVIAIACEATANHVLAVASDGGVWGWGLNAGAQLGFGTLESGSVVPAQSSTPVLVRGIDHAKAAAAGGGPSLVLREDGTVWGWGMNGCRTLDAQGTNEDLVLPPVQIAGLSNVVAITAGGGAPLAVTADGAVFDWGFCDSHRTVRDGDLPVRVPGLPKIVAVAPGERFALALAEDGTVWGWGSNERGQLGDGTVEYYHYGNPVRAEGLTGMTAIAAGREHSLAAALASGRVDVATDERGNYEFDPILMPDGTPGCVLRGKVSGLRGKPLAGVHMHLNHEEGGKVSIQLFLEEWPSGRFRLLRRNRSEPPSLITEPFEIGPAEACRRDFDMLDLPEQTRAGAGGGVLLRNDWLDISEVYYRVRQAFGLAGILRQELDYGLPLPIYVFDGARGSPAWSGRLTNEREAAAPPFIRLPDKDTRLTGGDWPDNVEYHEVGHHFQADAFGDAMPEATGNTNHAGYYRNPSSSDSWTEGFAEFHSMMVTKHVDRRPVPELYRMAGSYFDLETDYRAWDGLGWGEEFAVAGVLLDFEDGPADYRDPPQGATLRVDSFAVARDAPGGPVLVGKVTNVSPDDRGVSRRTMVVAVFSNAERKPVHVGVGVAIPPDLESVNQQQYSPLPVVSTGLFVIPIPPGLEFASVAVTAHEGRPGNVLTDDDPIDLELAQVWQTIRIFTSTKEDGNGRAFDVDDLYRAFRHDFGGRDADRDGMDDVDQIFVAHGFFADGNGNRRYEPGEAIGQSGHPAPGYVVETREGERIDLPAFDPRTNAPPIPAGMVAVDTGGVDATVVVSVSFPAPNEYRGYSYSTVRDEDGRVYVAVPPPESGATVTVLAVAEGYLPSTVARLQAADFWEDAREHRGLPFLSYRATMQPGTVGAGGPAADAGPAGGPDGSGEGAHVIGRTGGGRGSSPLVFWLGCGAALLAAASATLLLRYRRASRRPGGRSAGAVSGPRPPPPAALTWEPTHFIAAGGQPAWSAPDAAQAPVATLAPGLPVRVVEWWGGWARVVCSDGWSGWVDGSLLRPVAAAGG
jgi:alpha-tubulin suppressor-like RCC1 family protein